MSSRFSKRLHALEKNHRTDEEIITVLGVKTTRSAFARIMEQAKGTSIPVVRDIGDERLLD